VPTVVLTADATDNLPPLKELASSLA
jgi:hypothetical protein